MIWLTRPLEQSQELAQALAARGVPCFIEPLLHFVVPPSLPPLPAHDGLVVTSGYALRALGHLPDKTKPLWVVGEVAARHAAQLGFTDIRQGGGSAEGLIAAIAAANPAGTLLYARGVDVARDLRAELAAQRVTVQEAVVYEARAGEALSEAAQAILKAGKMQGVSLFSARTAQVCVQLLQAHGLAECARTMTVFCLSDNVARHADLPWRQVRVAARPTQEAMVEIIALQAEAA